MGRVGRKGRGRRKRARKGKGGLEGELKKFALSPNALGKPEDIKKIVLG